jgi:hypothetical protein
MGSKQDKAKPVQDVWPEELSAAFSDVLLWISANRAELESFRLDHLPELRELSAAAAQETEPAAPDVSLRLVPAPGSCGAPPGGQDASAPEDPSVQSRLAGGALAFQKYLLSALAAARSHVKTVEKERDHAVRERQKIDESFSILVEAQKSAVHDGWKEREAIIEALNQIIAKIGGKRKSSQNSNIPGSKDIHDPKKKRGGKDGEKGKPGRKPGFKGQARSLPDEKAVDGFKDVGLDGKASPKGNPRQGASGEGPCPAPEDRPPDGPAAGQPAPGDVPAGGGGRPDPAPGCMGHEPQGSGSAGKGEHDPHGSGNAGGRRRPGRGNYMYLDESDERSEPCPKCGSAASRDPQKDRLIERIELPEKLVETWLYVIKAFWCPTCRRHVFGELPAELESGLFGPNMLSFVAALKTHSHASIRNIGAVLECMGAGHVSTRTLDKALAFASDSVAGAVDELREEVPKQKVVNVDETGLKENGRQTWVWTFVCAAFTLFRVSVSRTYEALREVMTLDFTGILGSDHFGAYNKYFKKNPEAASQKCHAHLKREFNDLAETYLGDVRRYGQGLLRIQERLFELHHRRLADPTNVQVFTELVECGKELKRYAIETAPDFRKAQNMARRFMKYGDQYLTFIYNAGVEPTNNSAEQAIRHLVIDRHVTQGVRSTRGRERAARLWTVAATCRKQGRNPYGFIRESILARFSKEKGPSLLDP